MYGENSGVIRSELSGLLCQHRIQQRIGGPGIHTVPVTTTVEERKQIGRLIQRYRLGVLTWCQQALASAAAAGYPNRHSDRSPPDVQLRRRLHITLTASTASLPTMADLTTPQQLTLVEAWRRAAQGAAIGEHDFSGDMAPGRLDSQQRLTIVKDIAEIVRGLVVLDRRYNNIPAWAPLSGPGRLERAAEACAFITAADYTVDTRGRRPPATTIDGPARRGVAGVIQAQHNMLIHLARFLNALNLRRLLGSQRELAAALSARVAHVDPERSAAWSRRAETYQALQREARSIGGDAGDGSKAAAEAANAVSRLRRLPRDTKLGCVNDFGQFSRCSSGQAAVAIWWSARAAAGVL